MSVGEKRVFAIGLNPALQVTWFFPDLRLGEVNRAASESRGAGGKGVNFARAAKRLGEPVEVFLFVGGKTGEEVLRALTAEGVVYAASPVAAETRSCVTCLREGFGGATELIGPSGTISPEERDLARQTVLAALPRAKAIALCGTTPPGVDLGFYRDIAERRPGSVPLLLDAYKGVEALGNAPIDVLKINLDEGREFTGENDARDVAAGCFAKMNIRLLALTDGPRPSFLFTRDRGWIYEAPKLEGVINPIGAGDTVSAAFLSALTRGGRPEMAFADALAAGRASCLTSRPAEFALEKRDAERDCIRFAPL